MGRYAGRAVRLVLAIFFLFAYYGIVYGFAVDMITNAIDYLNSNGLTTVTIPVKHWDAQSGSWITDSYQIDLTGFLQLTLVGVATVAPLLVLFVNIVRL